MIKEEGNISRKFGKENPFTVPEGYFDSLTDRIMDVLPREESRLAVTCRKKHRIGMHWIGWCSIAAACVACVVFFNVRNRDTEQIATVPDFYAEEYGEYDEEYQQDMMQYAMLGHEDVYCYLSGTGF